MPSVSRIPLLARPLDLIWFIWFIVHIPLTALIDGQAIYPPHLVPPLLRQIYFDALEMSQDALMLGMKRGDPALFWFKGYLYLEIFFQLPLFFIGAYCLYYNIKRVYPLLLIYASSTTTTLIPCLLHILNPPPPLPQSTTYQLVFGLGSYVPFLLLPAGMMVDMAWRLGKVVGGSEVPLRGKGRKGE